MLYLPLLAAHRQAEGVLLPEPRWSTVATVPAVSSSRVWHYRSRTREGRLTKNDAVDGGVEVDPVGRARSSSGSTWNERIKTEIGKRTTKSATDDPP